MEFEVPEGATPIDPNEAVGLIPAIQYQYELNEFERNNIRDAYRWAQKSRKLKKELLTIHGLRLLHKEMFGQVWNWAGMFRKTEKNIGIDPFYIAEEIAKLCGDIQFQIENGPSNWDLLAITFHHRLISIHPFPNGNGRHARFATDLLLSFNKQATFTWGSSDLIADEGIRQDYLKALRKADRGEIGDLLKFAREE